MIGALGSGKTFWVCERVKALRKSGKHVSIIAITHASGQNFGRGAEIADHWVCQRVRTGGSVQQLDVLVCEEISQMEVQL